MERVSYQRSAARKGFSPVQVSRANIQEILKKGKQEAEYIRAAADSSINEKKRQAQAMQENYQFETRQSDANFQILQENLRNELLGIQEQSRIDAQVQKELFGNLSTLSGNAAKAYQNYKTKQDEYQKQADIAEYMSNPEYKAKVDAAFKGMSAQNAATETEAQSELFAASMASSDQVGVASMSKAFRGLSIGQRIAYVTDTARTFPAYISKAFKDKQSTFIINGQQYTVEQIENDQTLYGTALSQLRYRFLKENNMTGLSMEALSPGLEIIQGQEAQLFAEAGSRQVKAEKLAAKEDGMATLLKSGDPNLVASAVSQINYGNNGDFGTTKKDLIDLYWLTDTSGQFVLPENVREKLRTLKIGPGDLTLEDNKSLWTAAQRNYTRTQINDDAAVVQSAQMEFNQYWRETESAIREQLENASSPGEVQQIIDSTENEISKMYPGMGIRIPGWSAMTSRYLAENRREQDAEFETRKDTNLLDPEYVESIADPTFRAKAQKALQEQEARQNGPGYAANLKELESSAKRLTQISKVTDQLGAMPYYGLVLRDLKQQYKSFFQDAQARGMNNAEAAQFAMGEVSEQVNDSLDNKEGARYKRTLSNGSVLGFPNLKLTGPKSVPAAQVERTVNNDPDYPNKRNSVLTDAQLRNLSSAYYAKDGSFVFPEVVQRLQRRGVKPIGLINAQIDASNKELPADQQIRKIEPNAAMQRLEQDHPEVQEILSDMPNATPPRVLRALTRSADNPQVYAQAFRLPGSMGGGGITPLPGAITGNAKQRTVSVGRHLLENGYIPWQHSQFSINEGFVPEGGQRVMQRSYNSAHHHDEALDYPLSHNSPQKLNALYDYFMANKEAFGIRSVLWQVQGHFDHLHVEFDHKITGN